MDFTKRTLIAVAALAAAALGVGLAGLSAKHGTSAPQATEAPVSSTTASPQVMHFTSKTTKSSYVDNKPSGFSAGDLLTQHSVWYRGGDAVADMALNASVTLRTSEETGEVMFTAVAALQDGQIVLSGKFDVLPRNQTFRAAVTGGTGDYENARGFVVFKQVSGDKTEITLNLSA